MTNISTMQPEHPLDSPRQLCNITRCPCAGPANRPNMQRVTAQPETAWDPPRAHAGPTRGPSGAHPGPTQGPSGAHPGPSQGPSDAAHPGPASIGSYVYTYMYISTINTRYM